MQHHRKTGISLCSKTQKSSVFYSGQQLTISINPSSTNQLSTLRTQKQSSKIFDFAPECIKREPDNCYIAIENADSRWPPTLTCSFIEQSCCSVLQRATSSSRTSFLLRSPTTTMYYFLDVDIVIGMYNDAKVGGDRENI